MIKNIDCFKKTIYNVPVEENTYTTIERGPQNEEI